jgi:hypothetical protein
MLLPFPAQKFPPATQLPSSSLPLPFLPSSLPCLRHRLPSVAYTSRCSGVASNSSPSYPSTTSSRRGGSRSRQGMARPRRSPRGRPRGPSRASWSGSCARRSRREGTAAMITGPRCAPPSWWKARVLSVWFRALRTCWAVSLGF